MRNMGPIIQENTLIKRKIMSRHDEDKGIGKRDL